jgi:hypothetical protein
MANHRQTYCVMAFATAWTPHWRESGDVARTPSPAPPDSKTARTAARRQRLAAGLVTGKSVADLAIENGISRATASRDANSPEVRQIIVDLVSSHRKEIDGLFSATVAVIRDAYAADQLVVAKDGTVLNIGPDHYARLSAVGRFTKLITAGRPTAKPPDEAPAERPNPWSDFAAMMRQHDDREPS